MTEPTEAQDELGGHLLTVRGLVKDYPGVRALDGVDFAVEAGQVHCLVGQNGAGKSTLIKCIAGLVTPTAGEIVVDGAPLAPRRSGHGPDPRRGHDLPGARPRRRPDRRRQPVPRPRAAPGPA